MKIGVLIFIGLGFFFSACSSEQPVRRSFKPSGAVGGQGAENSSPSPVSQPNADAPDEAANSGNPAPPENNGSVPATPAIPSTPVSDGTPVPPGPSGGGSAVGNLTVNLTIKLPAQAGRYRNRGYVRAIYVIDSANAYVRTLEVKGRIRQDRLPRWAKITGEQIDGASGGTVTSGAPDYGNVQTIWDLKAKDGKAVALGNYTLWLEFSEENTPPAPSAIPAELAGTLAGIDGSNGYMFHKVPFAVTAAGAVVNDSKSPVFTNIVMTHKTN